MTTKAEGAYLAYLLRLWQVSDGNKLVWRVSLERAHPKERIGFDSLDELCYYLYELTSEVASAPPSHTDIERDNP